MDIAAVLTQLNAGDILFIDEIHRMPRAIEEYLYSAMEDSRLDVLLPDQKTVSINLPPFTLVAATTRPGLLSSPLISRFTLHTHLETYTQEELEEIIKRNAGKSKMDLTLGAITTLARAARGTPRIVNKLLSFTSDHALVQKLKQIDEGVALQVLQVLGITPEGLQEQDQRLLRYLYQMDERSVGLNTLATALGESPDSIETIYEPFLIQSGLLLRTPSGRRLSPEGLLLAQRLVCTTNTK
jgi:Holliday junction DNA helicase RuvB